MRIVRDSFLHFLADNLSTVTVHPCRRDKDADDTDKLEINALNVAFGDQQLESGVSSQVVILDLIHSNELADEDLVLTVFQLLNATYFCPIFDYTNPASPVNKNTNVYWQRPLRWRKVPNDFYVRYNCRLTLHFYLPQ